MTRLLTYRDDIRTNVGQFKRPEAFADSSESDLHLVRDADTASVVHMLVDLLQVSLWQNDLATAADHRLGEERRNSTSILVRLVDQFLHFVRVQFAHLLIGVLLFGVQSVVGARKWCLENRTGYSSLASLGTSGEYTNSREYA